MIQAESPEQILQTQANTSTTQKIHQHRKYNFSERFFYWWHKATVIFLTINGLVGTWESIKFIAIDFKELERLLALHQIQTQEVNQLVATAIIVAGTTMISILMALRLNKTKETSAQNIDLVVATILIVSTKYIQEALLQFNLLNILTSLF